MRHEYTRENLRELAPNYRKPIALNGKELDIFATRDYSGIRTGPAADNKNINAEVLGILSGKKGGGRSGSNDNQIGSMG